MAISLAIRRVGLFFDKNCDRIRSLQPLAHCHRQIPKMPEPKKTIRFSGTEYAVQREFVFGGSQIFVIGKLGNDRNRRIEKAVLRRAHRNDRLIAVHHLEDTPANRKQIRRLDSLDRGSPFARILQSGRYDGNYVVALEFIEGQSLRTKLVKKEISSFMAIRLYATLVNQLCFLHRQIGFSHGDLAPENMVVRNNGKSLVLIDFGSSFTFAESKAPPEGDGNRPVYLAPENFHGNPPSRISEQFSASAIFYEMLTGKVPYDVAKKENGRTINFVAASKQALDSSLPEQLWQLIDTHLSKALAFEPKGRFSTLNEWQDSAKNIVRLSETPGLLFAQRSNFGILEKISAWFNR